MEIKIPGTKHLDVDQPARVPAWLKMLLLVTIAGGVAIGVARIIVLSRQD